MDARQGSAAGSSSAPDEIEITPEMIEAGVRALCANSRYFYLDEEIVRMIFRAMIAKRA